MPRQRPFSLLLADATQMAIRADEDFAVGERRGGAGVFAFAERVRAELLELRRRLEDLGAAVHHQHVELPLSVQEGAPGWAAEVLAFPDILAGLELEALGDAGGAHQIGVLAEDDRGA